MRHDRRAALWPPTGTPAQIMHNERILDEGRNCWRKAHAARAAFLIDADDYYSAFVEAVRRAQKTIYILGWDMDSRVRLRPREEPELELGDFLNAVVSARPELHAYLLSWDYSVIFAMEREPLPTVQLGLRTHRRIHFRLDGVHPPGASHHQKIVVIDDQIAFSGGLDFAIRRWDTSTHPAADPDRVDPAGVPYAPFHDAQMLVDGDAAAALGELARERWYRATGTRLTPPSASTVDAWPRRVRPAVKNVKVGIARTEPAYNGLPGIGEVKQLYLDAIAAAEDHIYIENQYFTADIIGDALAARLREPDGPEIVIVLPRETPGWVQERTMGALRTALVERLRAADRHDRLRVFHPIVPGLRSSECVKVHSKILIVDDRFVRIASSNLNNRSMGLDTECDLALEADGDARVARAIGTLRNRLLGEHLGVAAPVVARLHARTGSLVTTVEALRTGVRTLVPLDGPVIAPLAHITDPAILDPDGPVAAEKFVQEFVPPPVREKVNHRVTRNLLLLIGSLLLAAAWMWTPLREWFDLGTLRAWTQAISTHPAAPLIILSAFVLGGLMSFPVTLLIVATALSFGPGAGFVYALLGSLLSVAVTHGVGRWVGPEMVERWSGPRLKRLQAYLRRRGLTTMVTVHMVPIGPFTLTNLLAGALRVRLRDHLAGAAIGMSPGILAITFFTDGLLHALLHPGLRSFAALAALAAVIAWLALRLRRSLATRTAFRAEQHTS